MTPAEMADWLEYQFASFGVTHPHFAHPNLLEAAKMLRTQPTDAQKIEALVLAGDAALFGGVLAKEHGKPHGAGVYGKESAHQARRAMRLLGLNPEGV